MALVSMTGFADGQGGFDLLRWRWEVRSVNGRSLELRLRMPPGLEGIEAAARILAGERFRRGNLQANLTLEQQDGSRGLRVDPAALAQAVRIARELAAETGLAPARVDGLMALKGVIVQEEILGGDAPARAARSKASGSRVSWGSPAATRVTARRGNATDGSSRKAARAKSSSVSLPAPLGPTTSTRRPGPIRVMRRGGLRATPCARWKRRRGGRRARGRRACRRRFRRGR